ncbi:acyltransferase family protein [Nocardioides sp.]|uniref:acyltransferase family protein n=1 Tax=Nocardioides sp. TaxID=35761 RepID=UPI0037842A6D
MSSTSPKPALRTDIQALRAVAVAMVVVYHLHPAALPGGFAGVDVFFVISGFLITAHLLRRPPTRPADFGNFWRRRARRLLPAALLVLAVTLVAVRLVAPATEWETNAIEARAAALYVLNWVLAARAVDYLALDSNPSAVQHYWSLSVEEQFYLFWPLLVGGTTIVARRLGLSLRGALAASLGLVVAASFVWSVTKTAADPAAAYFVTPTRIWELGAGGLLALAVNERPGHRAADLWRTVLGYVGLGLVLLAAFRLTGVDFPGYRAALPVGGAVLLIFAAPSDPDRGLLDRVLAVPPVQWLGKVSYSVYLWHWPLIVLLPYALGHELGLGGLTVALVATLVLAGVTERWLEQPWRSRQTGDRFRPTWVLAAGMAVVVGLATVQVIEVHRADDQARARLVQAMRKGGPCFGAAALDPGVSCPRVPYPDVVPSPELAAVDYSDIYPDVGGRQCMSHPPAFPERTTCTFGARRSPVTIALIGNSHAAQWLPALQVIAHQHHYRIVTHLASQCATADVPQSFTVAGGTTNCAAWVRRTIATVVAEKPDLVLMANRVSVPAVGYGLHSSHDAYVEGLTKSVAAFLDAGLHVLAVRDTPAPGFPVPSCVAEHEDDYEECDGTREEWVPDDPVLEVVDRVDDPDLTAVDMTDHLCEPVECHVVNGGVITYFDGTHMTATYSHTLGPYLEPAVQQALS